MIGKLKGIVDSYGEDFIILDVNGVGYLVHCSARTLQELPAIGQGATLSIETHVREDQLRLFGFMSDVEREWFRLADTALPSPQDMAEEHQEFPLLSQESYSVQPHSVVIFVAK